MPKSAKQKRENNLQVSDKSPLKWADGWGRIPIGDRKEKSVWKKNFNHYREQLVAELSRMGVSEAVVSFNTGDDARRDPGVTVYFSKPVEEDFGWQLALGIENPAPTLDEIDTAYRKKAGIHHPDRGGDINIYIALGKHREQARAWAMNKGRSDHDFALPCDRFTEPRWNLNAIRLSLNLLRRLEDFGMPREALERTFRGFRVALAAHASSTEESHGAAVNA